MFATLLFSTSTSEAQTAGCSKLKSQLASLNSANRGGSARYRRAAKAQQRQINRVQSRMNRVGCSARRKLFSREKHPSCRGLRNSLSSMKKNLRSLERKSGSGANRKRRSIAQAMKRQRCGDIRRASIKRSTTLEKIFGNSERKRRRQRANEDRLALKRDRRKKQLGHPTSTKRKRLNNYDTIRTFCVRTSDGYYFPVSFSTNKRSLVRDSQSCSNLCPGTEMKLYYHKTAGQGVEEMISVADGTPYTSLPSAFAYRKNYNPDYSCNYRLLDRKQEVQPARKDIKQEREDEQRTIARIAKPIWRIDRGQDPETLANTRGGFSLESIRQLDPAKNEDERLAQTRKVRIIGDSFFPNQQSVTAPSNQDRDPDQ